MLIPIVDKNDTIIGYKERTEITKSDIYRVAGLWIINSKNEILLSKRATNKTHNPNQWHIAVAGTVEKDETYLQNILKEANEELGINVSATELTKWPKKFIADDWSYFAQIYSYKTDRSIAEFIFDKKEVADIKWYTKDQLIVDLQLNPLEFTPSITISLHMYEKFQNSI